MSLSLFIFRRDLRTTDNLGFASAVRESTDAGLTLVPAFIYNPLQVDAGKNPYMCGLGVDLMTRCLLSLARSPEFKGRRRRFRFFRTRSTDDLDVLESFRPALAAVHFNSDVTPFARKRDARIQTWCSARGVACHAHPMLEYCLVDPAAMPKPYRVFSPFLKRHLQDAIDSANAPSPSHPPPPSTAAGTPPKSKTLELTPDEVARAYLAGSDHGPSPRKRGLAILARIRAGAFASYPSDRDDLALPPGIGTTGLSALLKFGAVSVREAFRAVIDAHGPSHELARQMMWRAYYDQIYYHGLGERAWATPACRATLFRSPRPLPAFDRWCKGETGVELVDAAMRELVTTGHMHGRARMVAAVYLTRNLGVDWRLGERFFASHLVDYHPPSNHGGWRWAAGCGADAMPPFRTMNPVRQAVAHDPDGVYRRRYTQRINNT